MPRVIILGFCKQTRQICGVVSGSCSRERFLKLLSLKKPVFWSLKSFCTTLTPAGGGVGFEINPSTSRVCIFAAKTKSSKANASPKYDRALSAFELLLVNRVISCGNYLSTVLAHRPGFRHQWTSEPKSVSDGITALSVSRKRSKDTKEMFSEDSLKLRLLQMHDAPDTRTNFDHEMLFVFLIYHLANNHAKGRVPVDEILYRGLSDQAGYHEMLVSIHLHRPQYEARVIDEVVKW